MKDLETGNFVNLVKEVKPFLLEEIVQNKERLLKQISKRRM
jgi:hypothetical protein